MARKGKRGRRSFPLRKVRVTSSTALGALAALDVVSGAITSAPTERIRVVSAHLSFSLADLTATDDGCEIGLAHGDYTAAEIEECLESQASIDAGDKIANEQANRLVRSIGTFSDTDTAGGSGDLNDGVPIKTKLNWVLQTGETLNIWARNGSGTVYTTGGKILCNGVLWVKD